MRKSIMNMNPIYGIGLFNPFKVMKKNKYKITFYKYGTRFTRICTRTKLSTIKFALKTAFNQRAIFKINKYGN